MKKDGFTKRIVSYQYIHSIEHESYSEMIRAINPQEGDVLLEAACGYGDISEHLIDQVNIKLFLLDRNKAQLGRISDELREKVREIIHCDYLNTPFDDNYFDKVFIKMGLHEVPWGDQKKAMKEIYRILKPGGKFITWELSLDIEIQKLFQDVIRKKDGLARFDSFITDRYLQTPEELKELFDGAGFKNYKVDYVIEYRFDSRRRLEEVGGEENLKQLENYIRENTPEELKGKLDYIDHGTYIEFTVNKAIVSGYK